MRFCDGAAATDDRIDDPYGLCAVTRFFLSIEACVKWRDDG